MSLALLSALVGGAFSIVVVARSTRRPRAHQLLWAAGLAMFATAALAGHLARAGGPTDLEYRSFYLFGAILNVAWLALGTLTLLAPSRVSQIAIPAVVYFSLVSGVAVFMSPVDLSAAADSGRGFQASPLPRILAAIGSGLGTIVLVGGALWSGWSLLRRGKDGRRAAANALIALGVLVVAVGGTATFTGGSGILETTNLVGLVLMFGGFLLT